MTESPTGRPRWLQASLRFTLLIWLVALVAIGSYANRVRQQRSARAHVESLGGFVTYDFEIAGTSRPDVPSSLYDLLGPDWFASIRRVYLGGRHIRDEHLMPLVSLSGLGELVLEETSVNPAARERFRRARPGCYVSQ